MKVIEKYATFILIGITLIFVFAFYGDVILAPNSYLFGASGDGMKNYFTYADQIKENSWTVSTAMNYPYGESFLYLDCQPVLTIVVKIIPFLAPYSIGITNLLMIGSIVISAWLLFLILLRFQVRPILAIIGAFSIAVLAPQLFRIEGHLALGYSFFIPLSWYLYLRFCDSDKKWKWSLWIGLNTLIWFFVHAYLGMIIVAFIFSCFFFDILFSKGKKLVNGSYIGQACLQLLLPLILFWGYATMADTHTGRTKNPFGYMESASNFDSVFLPNHPPLKPYFEQSFPIQQSWEGMAYVGIGSIIGVVLIVLFIAFNLVRYHQISTTPMNGSRQLITALFAAVLVLLISFGYPFKWDLMELLDRFSIIKNFRGIGRFAWVFYYVLTISVVVLLAQLTSGFKKEFWSFGIIGLLSLSYLQEGIPYHQSVAPKLTQSPNYFDKHQLNPSFKDALSHIPNGKYQAIIPLPFYHIGSENFGKDGTDKIYKLSMLLGYHTDLPLVANYSTRTSIWESKNILQILSPVFYEKPVQKDIKSEQPFLILFSHEHLSDFEDDLLSRATEIYKNRDFSLFEISKADLFSTDTKKWFDAFEQQKANMLEKDNFLLHTTDSSAYLFYNSYEDQPNPVSYESNGALATAKKDYTTLKDFKENELKPNTEYIASFWMNTKGKNYGQDIPNGICVYQVVDKDGSLRWAKTENMSAGLIINGYWSLIQFRFTVENAGLASSLFIKGDDYSKIIWHIDDLFIQEANVDIYQPMGLKNGETTKLFFNNHRLTKK
jgi:hypothetical protein